MKLSMELKKIFPQARKSVTIQNLTFDSRQVNEGSLFFALKGYKQDGHQFVDQAVQAGAAALVVMDSHFVPSHYQGEVIVVEDSRLALASAAQIFYHHPSQNLQLIGVTGTNGKTSTAYMLEHIFKQIGRRCGVMGTIDHHLGGTIWKTSLTTPDVIGLYSRLRDFCQLGAEAVAMEISSHALDQQRVAGLLLDVGIWTNLTRDHLDYHGTETAYFQAKEKMFQHHIRQGGFALLNGEAENLRKVIVPDGIQLFWFGSKGDFSYSLKHQDLEGSLFYLKTPFGEGDIQLGTPGFHNVFNATGALAASLCLGASWSEVRRSLENFRGAPGRLELVHKSPFVFVDYAHTPDALSSSLRTLKSLLVEGQKLWTVFGFGGDRDSGKRPLMVKEAMALADHIVLTSDNPRSEDPEKILEEGLFPEARSLLGQRIHKEVDRKKGIQLALQKAGTNDVILIAGKGHEDYQIIGDQVLPFSDQAVVKEYFS